MPRLNTSDSLYALQSSFKKVTDGAIFKHTVTEMNNNM